MMGMTVEKQTLKACAAACQYPLGTAVCIHTLPQNAYGMENSPIKRDDKQPAFVAERKIFHHTVFIEKENRISFPPIRRNQILDNFFARD
jgi:hypothetical protein